MPELAKTQQKTRVQLDLSPIEVERMNWMMTVCELESRKDLFNNALTLLEWATREVAHGRKIASFDDSTKERTILSMPALNTAAIVGPQYADSDRRNVIDKRREEPVDPVADAMVGAYRKAMG